MKSPHQISELKQSFQRFSTQAQDSKFYSRLALLISQDEEILSLIPENRSQPIPNLFLASINYLLSKYPDSELAGFFPNDSLHIFSESIMPVLKNFCLKHVEEIRNISENRFVQTNEVRRCALLYPALARVTPIHTEPVHLIDVGASSGLNLLIDHFKIKYSDGTVLGSSSLSPEIYCESRGHRIGSISLPRISSRRGIDLNPIDLANEDELRWALGLGPDLAGPI